MSNTIEFRNQITGLVLAGGMGRRMGGCDKGLQVFQGKPMVAWAIERLTPQVGALIINANQNPDAYAAFGYPVVPDEIAGFAGPLAGLHTGLLAATTPFLVTVPCDSPFLPDDLVSRLYNALETNGAELAVAKTGDQAHPVFSLVRVDVLDSLTAFLIGGGRKIDTWYAALKIVEVPFEDEHAFANINTLEELNNLSTPSNTTNHTTGNKQP